MLATYGDRLQVLAPHHRTHPRTPVEPVAHIHQPGVADEIFPRRTNLQHFDLFVSKLGPDHVFCFSGNFAPQMICRAQLCFTVMDPQIYRAL